MYNLTIAYIASFCAMFVTTSSYFFKKKLMYLIFQLSAIVFLILSYFFTLEFVAMIGIGVGLFRVLVYLFYENKQRIAPLYWAFIFSVLTIMAYFVGSTLKESGQSYYDILYVLSLCMFAFIFRIRDIKLVRYLCLIPLIMSALYNILINAPIFATLSYVFETLANVSAIIFYAVKYNKPQIISIKKENTDENN
ncbi:MAG: YgjV family protein [Clostridia bacterium]|nr:YgjV family protein [Clostridia bacterium]